MKFKLTAEAWAKLGDALKALYKKDGDNYVLDVDVKDSPDFIALQGNRDTILDEKKAEEKKRLELEEKNADDHIKGLEEKQEYEKLLGIKEEKFKDELQKANDKSTTLQLQLEDTLLNSAVDNLAVQLAGDSADLLKPHLRNRMVMKEVDGKQKLFITDVIGTASAMTTEQLGKEFQENALYAPILKGRGSSGGGSDNSSGSGGDASDFTDAEKHFKPESRNLTEQAKLRTSNPEMFKKLNEKYTSASRAQVFRSIV